MSPSVLAKPMRSSAVLAADDEEEATAAAAPLVADEEENTSSAFIADADMLYVLYMSSMCANMLYLYAAFCALAQ